MFLLCSLENWNQHFLEVRAVSLGSNKCIFDEFRVFWDTFVAKGVQMVLWFNPSTASKRCPTVWLVHAIITQIYRDAAKIQKKQHLSSHILPRNTRNSGPDFRMDDSICIQLEPLWFIMMFCRFFWPGERFKMKHGVSYKANKSSHLWWVGFNC